MTLGDIIKKYRKENNISMSEFACNCSLSKGYISMLENNINPRNNKLISPTLPSISKVASGMRIELDTLLKMMGNEQTVDLTCEHNSISNLDKPKTLDVVIEKCEEPSSKSQIQRISRYAKLYSLYNQLSSSNKDKVFIYTKNLLSTQQMEEDLLAAHAMTDVEQTSEDVQYDLDIMNDDSEWER